MLQKRGKDIPFERVHLFFLNLKTLFTLWAIGDAGEVAGVS